ncbi:GNAT family N-acetyltransferase [Ahrensia sp. R2A130]|uniref:GNAT family N-acetyltransferase n=1 Tax=Ahrensia sp. R2A130 TaxID=744979 RepID=UPI0001E09CB5|nr:GNAT family N-acetyltransferase [Ahrensia sp. R2A130]EFL88205.1 acetyltransferase, gnat family protein [Ahrensia sp. R2A130]
MREPAIVIRQATRDEFANAVDWAAAEGWNPGLHDLDTFYDADPEGFIMGFVDGEPSSSISVVRYGDNFGFLGFYIVVQEHRGTGLGLATWNAGMAHLAGRTIALDGVVDQQENYAKSGFQTIGRNVRYTGVPVLQETLAHGMFTRTARSTDLDDIATLDRLHFPHDRTAFLESWCLPPGSETRHTVVCEAGDGAFLGFATIRRCRDGYKLGPVLAHHRNVTQVLLAACVRSVPECSKITIDVPHSNNNAIALVESLSLQPVFETARMVKGNQFNSNISTVFGICTLELG